MMNENSFCRYEDELYQSNEPVEPSKQYVIFKISNEWYGINIRYVMEVVLNVDITILPHVPEHILGIINLRGNIISITDLHSLLNINKSKEYANKRVIIVSYDEISTAIINSGYEENVDIPNSQIKDVIGTLNVDQDYIIEGQVKWEGKLIGILSAEKVIQMTKL